MVQRLTFLQQGNGLQGNIADDAVGTAQLAATGTASATTFLRGDNSWATVDTSGIDANKEDIALLAFKTQANGNLARYNLVDQSVDAFEDASGIDTGTSTGEVRDSAAKYYYGGTAGATTTVNLTSGTSWDCSYRCIRDSCSCCCWWWYWRSRWWWRWWCRWCSC